MSEVLSHLGHPPVLVMTSPALDNLMSKNYLSFVELLKPFGHPPLLNQPMNFRTINRGTYQLVRWGVRFMSVIEMEEMETRMAERYLELALTMAASDGSKLRQSDAISSMVDVSKFNNLHPDPVPWYTRYRSEMINTLRFKDTELIDQPLALMIAVAASEPNPQQFIESTKNPAKLPSGLQRGIYDINIARCIVIVHDKHSEADDPQARQKAIEVMKSLGRIYGSDVLPILCEINGFPVETPNPSQRDLWSSEVLQGRAMSRYGGGGAKKDADPNAFVGEVRESGVDVDEGIDSFHLLPFNFIDLINQSVADANSDVWRIDKNFITGQPATGDVFHAFLVQSLQTPTHTARGQFLTPFDVEHLANFVHTFIVQRMLPHVEQRLFALNEKVAAVRGISNRLKAGWKSMIGGGRPSNYGYVQQLGTYHLQSMESQARQLADLSYVMQDFEAAEQCYSYCIRDYRNDARQFRVWHHLASANEMQALTLAHLEPNRYYEAIKEHIDTARSIYISVGDHRRAARVAILASESYRIRSPNIDRWREGVSMTLKAARREFTPNFRSVRAAMMVEYVAYLFLLAPAPAQPHIRKYSLSLIVAARLYRHFGHKVLEARADNCAAQVYGGKEWQSINGHVNAKLGKELFQLSRFNASVNAFVSLIGKLHNIDRLTGSTVNPLKAQASRAEQQHLLDDLVYVVNEWQTRTGTGREITGLDLPAFIDESVKVHCNDSQTVASQYAQQAWNAAARMQRMTLDSALCNKSLFQPSMTLYKENDRGGIVRERITVEMTVINPLQLELLIKNVRLKVKHQRASAGSASPTTVSEGIVSVVELPASLTVEQAQSMYGNDKPFVVYCQTLSLAAAANTHISLSLIPLVEGTLMIEGVQWEVFDSLRGYHAFALPQRQIPLPLGRRGQPQYQPDPSLTIKINTPAPLLTVTIGSLPSQCYHGEVHQSSITLRNVGELSLTNLQLRISHPGFVLVGLPITNSGSTSGCYGYNWNDVMIALGLSLKPNESISLPLYLRATREGQQNLQFLFRYESDDTTIKPRLAYVSHAMTVQPIIGVKVSSKPSFADVHDSLLSLEIVDRQAARHSSVLNVSGVSVLSKTWAIAPIGTKPSVSAGGSDDSALTETASVMVDDQCDATLTAGSSLSLMFRITSLPSLLLPTPSVQSTTPLHHSQVQLGSSAITRTDCAQSPYSELVAMEKALIMEEERQALLVNPVAVINDSGAANKIDLVISYTVNSDRVGFYHLCGLSTMKIPTSACPIKVHLSFPQHIEIAPPSAVQSYGTPFAPLVSLPVTITVKNLLEDQSLSFVFETLPIEEEFDSAKRSFKSVNSSQLHGRYLWRGNTRCRVTSLERQSVHTITLVADILRYGAFNLNRFRFTVDAGAGKKPRVFFFPIQNIISVMPKYNSESETFLVVTDDTVAHLTNSVGGVPMMEENAYHTSETGYENSSFTEEYNSIVASTPDAGHTAGATASDDDHKTASTHSDTNADYDNTSGYDDRAAHTSTSDTSGYDDRADDSGAHTGYDNTSGYDDDSGNTTTASFDSGYGNSVDSYEDSYDVANANAQHDDSYGSSRAPAAASNDYANSDYSTNTTEASYSNEYGSNHSNDAYGSSAGGFSQSFGNEDVDEFDEQ